MAGRKPPPLTRRRTLALIAGAGALPLTGAIARLIPERHASMETVWRGTALGAQAQARLWHPDANVARRMLAHCLNEVDRLESIFSLYRAESELSRLNRTGRLRSASQDLRILLGEAQNISAITGGAFDITVQPLFRLYANHFATDGTVGPSPHFVAQTRQLVSYKDIDISDGSVGFLKNGMAVTLNGVAQGYITDRIADMLRHEGFEHVLLQLGETVGISPPGDNAAWRVALPHAANKHSDIGTLALSNKAAATSRGAATPFDQSGDHHHIFDPDTGLSAHRYAAITVISKRATVADALSTGLSNLPETEMRNAIRRGGAEQAVLVRPDGTIAIVKATV